MIKLKQLSNMKKKLCFSRAVATKKNLNWGEAEASPGGEEELQKMGEGFLEGVGTSNEIMAGISF